jgi:hypothetical protein
MPMIDCLIITISVLWVQIPVGPQPLGASGELADPEPGDAQEPPDLPCALLAAVFQRRVRRSCHQPPLP